MLNSWPASWKALNYDWKCLESCEEFSTWIFGKYWILLCDKDFFRHQLMSNTMAHQMLGEFVQDYATLYGESTITSNVHNLKHLYDNVCSFGVLDDYSTYPFESMLQSITYFIRTGNNIMPQVTNRVREFDNMNITGSSADQDLLNYPVIAMKQNRTTLHVWKIFLVKTRPAWWMVLVEK